MDSPLMPPEVAALLEVRPERAPRERRRTRLAPRRARCFERLEREAAVGKPVGRRHAHARRLREPRDLAPERE